MFHTLSTLTIGLNYGAPAGDLKGKHIPLNVAQDTIAYAMAASGIDCYTVIDAKGYWMGQPEASLRVEVYHQDGHKDVVKAARFIKEQLLQEAVLVTKQETLADLV